MEDLTNNERAAMRHDLKTWPDAFQAIVDGHKTHEYRLNDRNFQVGDTLRLREWAPDSGYTERVVDVCVSYVGKDGFGIPEGYAVLSIQLAETTSLRQQLAEYEGIEGRCSVGHNKKFTYELLGKIGCVACERDEVYRQLSEAEKRTTIKICNVLNDLYVKADSMAEFGEEVRSWYYQESENLNRRDSKEKHDNGD